METKISKLPKWAQEHISHLERIIREKERLIHAYAEQKSGTRITTDLTFQDKMYLPDSQPLYFNVGENPLDARFQLSVHIERQPKTSENRMLIIRSVDRGEFYVKPRASNAVDIVLLKE